MTKVEETMEPHDPQEGDMRFAEYQHPIDSVHPMLLQIFKDGQWHNVPFVKLPYSELDLRTEKTAILHRVI